MIFKIIKGLRPNNIINISKLTNGIIIIMAPYQNLIALGIVYSKNVRFRYGLP